MKLTRDELWTGDLWNAKRSVMERVASDVCQIEVYLQPLTSGLYVYGRTIGGYPVKFTADEMRKAAWARRA